MGGISRILTLGTSTTTVLPGFPVVEELAEVEEVLLGGRALGELD
jgi:hypothetical protein